MITRTLSSIVLATALAGAVAPAANAGPFLDKIKQAGAVVKEKFPGARDKLIAGASRAKCAAKVLLGRTC